MVQEKRARITKTKKEMKKQTHPSKWFVLHNGKHIRNLKELAEEIGDMEDYVFFHHVNDDRNDFCSWIRDVFDEYELAEEIGKVKSKQDAQISIYKHLIKKLWREHERCNRRKKILFSKWAYR